MEAKYVLIIFSKEVLAQMKMDAHGISRVDQIEIWDVEAYHDDDMETFQAYPHTAIPLDSDAFSEKDLTALHWLLSTDNVYSELTMRETIQNLITLALNTPPQPQVLLIE